MYAIRSYYEDEAMLDAWLDIQQEEEILLPLHDDIIEFSKSQY